MDQATELTNRCANESFYAARCQELTRALEFCRDRLESWETLMSEATGVAGWHLNGKVAEWGELDEPTMTVAGIEVANRVLAGGTFVMGQAEAHAGTGPTTDLARSDTA
jgi:hypothetical protein